VDKNNSRSGFMINLKSKILLFTASFPYELAAENTFIEPELPQLKTIFSSITIFPKFSKGKKTDIPEGIFVNHSFSRYLIADKFVCHLIKNIFLSLSSNLLYQEIRKNPKKTLHPRSLIRIIFFLGTAMSTKKWIEKYIVNNNIDLSKTIFYTYWLDGITMGICLAKVRYPEIIVVSRAHGTDIYDERHIPPYNPFRPEIFYRMNKIYPASRDGQQYFLSKYPSFQSLFECSTLGIKNPHFITKQSSDGIFRIVTCSYLISVKRIELLIYGLKRLGELKNNQQFVWTHIGNGPLEKKLIKLSRMILPKNVKFEFLGFLPNYQVINFYKNNPIDLFMNVSESEGGNPVSIMEAQSCGIPVIASAVGGNKEIVNKNVGIFLQPDPTPSEIAEEIINFMRNPELIKERKIFSKKNFDERYDSEVIFQSFAQKLLDLSLNHSIEPALGIQFDGG
jgi:colanic acid/amylovoran biosynthesis glycosyltransferase